jgi:hypothetical protein
MTNTRKAPELGVRAASSVGAALALLLVPKCPLCVAAYLGALGVSASVVPIAAPLVRPVAWLGALLAAVLLVLGVWRRRRREVATGCCR